jgi:CheY-like chemotaxis protein
VKANSDQAVILLAEDREDDIVIMQRAFAQTDFPGLLFAVRNGEEAIAYLQGATPYENRAEYPLPVLLLLDLKMPRKDGFEVLTWIRQQSYLVALRVIVLTSSEENSDLKLAYELGANSFLAKPTKFEEVIELTRFINGFWLDFNQTLPFGAAQRPSN